MKQLFTIFILSTIMMTGQDSIPPSWNYSAVTSLNINQVSLTNWAQGGDNTFAWTVIGNFGAEYKGSQWSSRNSLKLAFGRTKQGESDFRTNDNEFYLENLIAYNVGWKIDPFFSNTVRTSLTDGFDYKNPLAPRIAGFFDPGYITQSLGFAYNPNGGFDTRLGVAFQEVFTNKFRNYSDDPLTTDKTEAFRFDTGLESVTNAKYNLDENLLLDSKLRLFTRFKSLDVWDIRWDNTITAKVSKYINVNLNVLLLYEKNISPKTQLKQALQLGITYAFI
ncbi:MAG: DUF3078 domain-containing protein [Ignavibacteriales bacterium]|nr:hypothetical protein [Ignavibacteriaceae bacterium]MCK6614390.1 DUF3078 domain-containing protein [Ignavibacteriaceae bacterium]QOJ27774.1 MAG: DUF3078 domain-containing protein [Ignavibacteriales bacterium]